jgi:very-short-patch-repair endonuclease
VARQRHKWDPVCDPPKRLVRPVPLDPTGLSGPTRGQARGSRWRRTTYGFYVPASVDGTLPEQRVLEKSLLLPAGGAVTGWGSLRLWGGRFFDGLLPDGVTLRPVPLVVGPAHHRAARDGVTFARDRLAPDEVVIRRAVPCTVVERALFDEMRTSASLRKAVVAVDMAAAGELTSVRRTRAYVDRHPGWDGVPLTREALDLADENSRSPRETELRLIWVLDAHLPRPLANREIFDRRTGALLGVADLLDVEAGLVGEFDGGEHAGAGRRSKDARRDGLFRDHGLEVFRVTAVDLAQPRLVVEPALAARRRAKFLPAHARPWTIEPPESWEPARSLDEILGERDLLREMHEQWEHERPRRGPEPPTYAGR